MSFDYLLPYSHEINLTELISVGRNFKAEIIKKTAKDYSHLLEKISALPKNLSGFEMGHDGVSLGDQNPEDSKVRDLVIDLARELIPWRKGPFEIFNEKLDAEWRSDFKWERVKPFAGDLRGKRVLDIGCNNGYFMFQMLKDYPELLLGIDPVVHYYSQFQYLKKLSGKKNLHMEILGVEHLNYFPRFFDVIFSMGIIYHHRNPLNQLLDIKNALRPKGKLILETIGIPGDEPYCLFPESSYAKMRNVFFIPTLSCLINWAKKAKFKNIQVISKTPLTIEEQRLTHWCPSPHQSLENFLNPSDPSKTIENFPAPWRFAIYGENS